MRIRVLLAAAALTAAAPAAPSDAASCPLVTDARGDSTPLTLGTGTATPADDRAGARATDIVSSDAWTDASWLHVVVRVPEVPTVPDVPRAHGHQWAVDLRAEGGFITVYTLENNGAYEIRAAWVRVVGDDEAGAGAGLGLRGAKGSQNVRTGEVRMSVPLAAIAPHTSVGRGARWMPVVRTFFEAGTPGARAPGGYASVGQGGWATPSDTARGLRAMRVGQAECVHTMTRRTG